MKRRLGRLWVACGLLAISSHADAQAWLGEKGDLSFTLTYNDVLNKHHYLANGDELDVGHTRSQIIGLQAAYVPLERLQVSVGLPFVQTLWEGEGHHGPEVDTGHHNRTITDLRVELHYQVLEEPLALAPFVSALLPTHRYPVLGHAAPGRGLNEFAVGFWTGKALADWLPGSYVQLRYSYAFVQRVAGISHNHSNVDLETGYFLTPQWLVQASGSWQWTHGGIDIPVPPTSPLFPYHDQLADAEFFNLSGGLVWFASARTSVFFNYTQSLRGSDAHKVDQSVTLGLGYRPFAR